MDNDDPDRHRIVALILVWIDKRRTLIFGKKARQQLAQFLKLGLFEPFFKGFANTSLRFGTDQCATTVSLSPLTLEKAWKR